MTLRALMGILAIALMGCAPIRLTRPVTKIGLVAPFEGAQRPIGYESLYAARLAVRDQNDSADTAGWLFELVALDHGGSLEKHVRQARALAADPGVVQAVAIATAAEHQRLQDVYQTLGLPLVLVDPRTGDEQGPDKGFSARYLALSMGIQPGPLALRTYEQTRLALTRIDGRIRIEGRPAR